MARRSLCKARHPLKINSELLWSLPTGGGDELNECVMFDSGGEGK
jgi:hypothetical protein